MLGNALTVNHHNRAERVFSPHFDSINALTAVVADAKTGHIAFQKISDRLGAGVLLNVFFGNDGYAHVDIGELLLNARGGHHHILSVINFGGIHGKREKTRRDGHR